VNERAQRLDERLEPLLLVAALLVIPDVAIEAADARGTWGVAALVLNWAVWLVFALALVATTAVAERRWAWLRERPLDVAIVVLTPPFAPAVLLGFRLARLLRLLRLLRLVRTGRLARKAFSLEGVKWACGLVALVALGGGAAFTNAESGQHYSTADGLWWAVTTMTTIGSDIQPKTGQGRVIEVAVMLVGIGFVAFLTAAVAQRFVAQIEEPKPEWEEGVVARLDAIVERLASIEERLQREPTGEAR
jgi:voltage-gated potassium channel